MGKITPVGPGPLVVANGGTGDTSVTAYAPICGGTSTTGALQSASTGISTSGFVLTSNGSSSLPSFQSVGAAGSGWVLIQSQTVSSVTSVTFTTGISATYTNYAMMYNNFTCGVTDDLLIQLSSNGGSSYISSGYFAGQNDAPYNSATLTNHSTTSGLYLARTSPTFTDTGVLYINDLTDATYTSSHGTNCQSNGSGNFGGFQMGTYGSQTAMNALQVVIAGGQSFSGTFSLFGILT